MSSSRVRRLGFVILVVAALVAGVWAARERVSAPQPEDVTPMAGATAPSPGPSVVSGGGSGGNGTTAIPGEGARGEARQPLPALLDNARKSLPRKGDIARAIQEDARTAREVQHGPPRMIVEYAEVLGDLAERYEQDPASREAIDGFYRECALQGEAPDSIRAVCYNHALAHRPPASLKEARSLQVPSRVMEIARRLPKARTVR